jgi:hypothetical protein
MRTYNFTSSLLNFKNLLSTFISAHNRIPSALTEICMWDKISSPLRPFDIRWTTNSRAGIVRLSNYTLKRKRSWTRGTIKFKQTISCTYLPILGKNARNVWPHRWIHQKLARELRMKQVVEALTGHLLTTVQWIWQCRPSNIQIMDLWDRTSWLQSYMEVQAPTTCSMHSPSWLLLTQNREHWSGKLLKSI